MFFMISSFKEKLKNQTQKAQNKSTRFCLSLPPRSRINPLHFRKIKIRPARDRVEKCIVNTVFKYKNGVLRNTHEMLKPHS